MDKIDITSTALEKGLDMIKGFAEKLVGGAIEEAGLLITDRVRLRRLKNQIDILSKAQKIAMDANIDIKQINLKVLVPLLELCSLEEEETLQDMWANLLANYADSNKIFCSSVFPYILSQLSTKEASQLLSQSRRILVDNQTYRFNLSEAEINNLVRLGLVSLEPVATIKNNNKLNGGGQYIKFERSDRYKITKLAREFLFCCTPPITDTL